MSFYGNHINLIPASQSDWKQNNSNEPTYIKNRPFFIDDNGKIYKLNKEFLPDEVALKEDIKVTSVNGMTGDVIITTGDGSDIAFNGIYVQEEEPVDAKEGALWIDLDEEIGLLSVIITNPETAAVGQLIMVEAIDENGVPIKWKVVDASSLMEAILPTISAEDNGKTLTVVDGKWQLV